MLMTLQELKDLNESAREEAEWARFRCELASARQWEAIAGAAAALISLEVRIVAKKAADVG